MKRKCLPLGVDLGTTRVRIVAAERTGRGGRLCAVASREVPAGSSQFVASVIEDAVRELGWAERRCVAAIAEPDGVVRSIKLPAMTALERERAARFEAARYVEFPLSDAIVRLHPIDERAHVWALGIARTATVEARVALLRAAGLRPIAVEHESWTLARMLPGFDAILDAGHRRTRLHLVAAPSPVTLHVPAGGADLTDAIVRELNVDSASAEKRKRILGTAGAGERARSALVSDVVSLIQRARTAATISRIAFVGNASRLPGFGGDVAHASGAACESAVSAALVTDAYPEDVIRAGAADWTLAAGLALWSCN